MEQGGRSGEEGGVCWVRWTVRVSSLHRLTEELEVLFLTVEVQSPHYAGFVFPATSIVSDTGSHVPRRQEIDIASPVDTDVFTQVF